MLGKRIQERGDDLLVAHTPEAVARRLTTTPAGIHSRDFVYGAMDGAVTTFAVVASVRGASLSTTVVVILGLANLVADGFSMAMGSYAGQRTAEQRRRRLETEELEHIRQVPQGEREEIRQIFAAKGFSGKDLERVVKVITSDRQRWAQTMLVEEHGLPPHELDALRGAAVTFGSFGLAGFVPLLPFVVDLWPMELPGGPYPYSVAATVAAFVLIGIARGPVAGISKFRAAVETLLLGGSAAMLAFVVGVGLRGIV